MSRKVCRYRIAQLRIALRFAIIAIVAVSRCCHVMIEQPRSSVMRLLEHYKMLGSRLGPQMWGFVNLCESYGHISILSSIKSLWPAPHWWLTFWLLPSKLDGQLGACSMQAVDVFWKCVWYLANSWSDWPSVVKLRSFLCKNNFVIDSWSYRPFPSSPRAQGLHASSLPKALPEGPTEIEEETKEEG